MPVFQLLVWTIHIVFWVEGGGRGGGGLFVASLKNYPKEMSCHIIFLVESNIHQLSHQKN